MTGIATFVFVAISCITAEIYSQCMLNVYMSRDTQFDGVMVMSNVFNKHLARSQMDCVQGCSVQTRCKSNLFDPGTHQCQLFTDRLTTTAGLTSTPGAIYHYKSIFSPGQFQCPQVDGNYHTINFPLNETCIQIRAVHVMRNQSEAIADCEATGGRLMVIHTAQRKQLFADLTGCPGFFKTYIVDGTNTNAANFSATDAYTTSYGEVITVGDMLWDIHPRYSIYEPDTKHCLSYHWGHHDTRSCSTYLKHYMCEKQLGL